MYQGKTIALIMPARNEALALPHVLRDVPPEIDRILVIDNGSTDDTARTASLNGAEVVSEPVVGYGSACLAGIRHLQGSPPDLLAFADADGSDDLSRLGELLSPVAGGTAHLVLERRMPSENDSLSMQQRLGNRLATLLIRFFWGYRYEDLGPMRVISWNAMKKLEMEDGNYGWTVEMQIRALKAGLLVAERPIPYRRRIAGRSKVSRTWSGSMKAGVKILSVIFREAMSDDHHVQYTRSDQ